MLNLQVMFKVKKTMKIGEVAKIVGISSSAIRFYERHGLIKANAISRAANGYRSYSQKDIDEILLIIRFKEFGLELEEIKELLGDESKSCGDLITSLDMQIAKCRQMEALVKKRIELLQTARNSCEFRCMPGKQVRKCCS